MPHYNTTNEKSEQVKMFELSNMKQEDKVLEIAKELKRFSPSDIYKHYPVASTPITSIRRALHTLTNIEAIKKTGEKVKGMFGRNEYQYQIKE